MSPKYLTYRPSISRRSERSPCFLFCPRKGVKVRQEKLGLGEPHIRSLDWKMEKSMLYVCRTSWRSEVYCSGVPDLPLSIANILESTHTSCYLFFFFILEKKCFLHFILFYDASIQYIG